jgi:protein-tyrosine phosphatase
MLDLLRMQAGSTGEKLMEELYRALAGEVLPAYRQLFSLLGEGKNTPLLFHCSAGKDRTGLAAALILYALGTDKETIFADYTLSSDCLKSKYAAQLASMPQLEPMLTVRRSYLEAAFSRIDTAHGGLDAYLEELGADTETLRELYTEPAP